MFRSFGCIMYELFNLEKAYDIKCVIESHKITDQQPPDLQNEDYREIYHNLMKHDFSERIDSMQLSEVSFKKSNLMGYN